MPRVGASGAGFAYAKALRLLSRIAACIMPYIHSAMRVLRASAMPVRIPDLALRALLPARRAALLETQGPAVGMHLKQAKLLAEGRRPAHDASSCVPMETGIAFAGPCLVIMGGECGAHHHRTRAMGQKPSAPHGQGLGVGVWQGQADQLLLREDARGKHLTRPRDLQGGQT